MLLSFNLFLRKIVLYLLKLTCIWDASEFQIINLFIILHYGQRLSTGSLMLLSTYSVVQGIFTLKCPAFSDVPINLEPYWGHSSLWVPWVTGMKRATLLDTGWASTSQGHPPPPSTSEPDIPIFFFIYLPQPLQAHQELVTLAEHPVFINTCWAWRPFVFFLVSISSSIMSCPHFPMPSLPKFVRCFSGMHWPLVLLRSLSSVSGWSSGRCSSTDAPTASAQS